MAAEAQFRKRIRGSLCVYCGEEAGSLDHFPPRSLCRLGYLLPACRECNTIAGTTWPEHFEERAAYVKRKLRLKYKKEIRTPEWSDSEMTELGRNIKGNILSWEKRRKIALERIAWSAVAYLSSIDHNNCFVPTFAEDDFLEKNKEVLLRMQEELKRE